MLIYNWSQFLMSALPIEDQATRDGGSNSHGSIVTSVSPINGSKLQLRSPLVKAHDDMQKKTRSNTNLCINQISAKAFSSSDTSRRKYLEKTRTLLQEAKYTCKIDSLASEIDAVLAKADRLLSKSTGASGLGAKICSYTGSNESPKFSQLLDDMTEASLFDNCSNISGVLWKRGKRLRKMTKRYYVLQGNFLYNYVYVYYANKSR